MSQKKLFINSIISLLVVAICLFVFIENSEGDLNFKSLLINISNGWVYLLITSILLIVSVYFRAIRWKYLFKSNSKPEIKDLLSSQLIGYFINNIFPIRIGDFAKSYITAKKTDNKTSYILGSIIMERVLDTLMLFIFLIITIWYYGTNYLGINLSFISNINSPFFYGCLITFLVIYFLRLRIRNFIPIIVKNIFNQVWRGFTGIHSSGKSIVIFSSIVIWLIYWTNAFLIQMIFPSLNLGIIDCLLILVVSSFIQLIPTGFGALGIFHLGVESVLLKLGVSNYHNFLIILWLYSYIVYTMLGSYYFFKESKFTLKNLYSDWVKSY